MLVISQDENREFSITFSNRKVAGDVTTTLPLEMKPFGKGSTKNEAKLSEGHTYYLLI